MSVVAQKRTLRTWAAGLLAMLLFASAFALTGAGVTPALAGPSSHLQISKKVNGQDAERSLVPGTTVTYTVNFSVENESVTAPVSIVDVLPAAFEGWQILGISATVNGSANNITVDLPGVSPASGGTIGAGESNRTIAVGISRPLAGGKIGMSADDQGVLSYQITIPENLAPDWYANNEDLLNTATFAAENRPDLTVTDDAIISVDVPVTIDVTPVKTWTPSAQVFEPDASSLVTIGGTQSSNVDATTLSLADPADPALAVDGATSLPAGNPFNFVDFDGFTTDPTTNLPSGATSAAVDVYYFDGASWNWTAYDATMVNANIAGVRTSYSGVIPPGASVSQGYDVVQRATNRSDNSNISTGYTANNTVEATVVVDGKDPLSKEASAELVVTPEQIEVEAGKSFIDPATGKELTSLTAVGGDTVGVVLHARNKAVPNSTTLNSLTVREPGAGADTAYFSEDLAFAGFDNTTAAAAWPAGATNATIKWTLADNSVVEVTVAAGDPLPNPLPGQTIKGFEIVYAGSIAPDALADIKYSIRTSEDLGEANAPAGPFRNVVQVEGTRTGLTPVNDNAQADLTVVAPAIDVTIDKKLSPSIVFPGGKVIVQLPTNATTTGSQTKPTEIVVTDEFTGEGTFWDAYNATEIIAPIQVPTGGTLQIQTRDEAGNWTTFSTLNTDSAVNIAVPGDPDEVFGVRFIYTKADGFGTSTNVKPNIGFTARADLRKSGDTTTPHDTEPFTPSPYENTAKADGTGKLGDREVTDDDTATGTGSIRHKDAFGVGPLWAEKDWLDPTTLMSQSGASASSKQRWALNEAEWDRIVLTDPAAPTATGAGTVFEAFNLTAIRPITLNQDPQLQWDSVTVVQLTSDGTTWTNVTAPDGSWMGNNGFKGYSLSETEQQNTIGVRLVIEENGAARAAAADAGDIGAPAVGTGVTSSAAERSYVLDWQLRERARGDSPTGPPKWIIADAVFNCHLTAPGEGDEGCIDNIFEVRATDVIKLDAFLTANDTILLIDGVPNVNLEKSVVDEQLVAPQPGDIAQEFYPTTRYTLTAKNSSNADPKAAGQMRLSSLRVTDSATDTLGNPAMGTSPFAGRNFASESANHFNTFTLTGISFDAFPATSRVDEDQSMVELWLYSDQNTPVSFSITQIKAGAADALLDDVIGVSVTYQGTDPLLNGNRIVAGDALTMHLDVQLRAKYRVSDAPVTGGPVGSAVRVPNEAAVRGKDLIVKPTLEPTDGSDAFVDLTDAAIEVHLAKAISVTNTLPGTNADTVYEADPQAPVNVTVTATPGGSTAPLKALTIEDTTAEFWAKFEFVSMGTGTLPTDVDRNTHYVFDGTDWFELSSFVGDTADIVGVRTVYDRIDAALFPVGATSWSSGWGKATMPFTVKLRADAVIDWKNPVAVDNLANTVAERSPTESVRDTAEADVDFSAGVNALLVSKRAPNDTGNHQVNPLDALTWQLIFTNTGNSLLPIEQVVDKLPTSLRWDGEQPTFVSSGGSGLSSDPVDISVTPSADGSELVFEWPEGSRMQPGETMTINLALILQPGLLTGEHATNEVVVTAGDALATCAQPTNNGQRPTTPAEDSECSNTNYVEPLVGTYVNGLKTVNGEATETDGEFLVSGGTLVDSATKLPTGEACDAANWFADDYTRTPCIAYTAVGATDNWKLEYFNIGTNPLQDMTIIDMLPRPGDEMLAGYKFPRGSNFRPVIDPSSIELLNLPAGAVSKVEITTQTGACYSTGSSFPARWTDDPTCSATTSNPANGFWVDIDEFLNGGGLAQDIAGFRVNLNLRATPLAPGSSVSVKFDTVNQVIDHTMEGLQPSLADYATPRVAWNQSGVMASDIYGASIPLSKAPPVAGITVKTGDLVVSKDIVGDARYAPDSFTVALSCTVPDGTGGRVALDMGSHALLTVPGNLPGTDPADRQSVIVPNVPIGANCDAAEVVDPAAGPIVGEFGEIGRSIVSSVGVNPTIDGLSAEIRIRDHGAGSDPAAATLLGFTNTYGVGDLVIEKALRSTSDYDLSAEQRNQSFDFEVVCVAGETTVERTVTVKAGTQETVTDLPSGAECVITETNDRGAAATSSTIAGITVDGTSRGSVVLAEDGTHILFTNGFVGPTPPDLSKTGGQDNTMLFIGIGAGVLLLGGLVLLLARRRKEGASHDE